MKRNSRVVKGGRYLCLSWVGDCFTAGEIYDSPDTGLLLDNNEEFHIIPVSVMHNFRKQRVNHKKQSGDI